MKPPRNNTAIDIYRDFRRDATILIGWLGDELSALDDNAAHEPGNWKFAGDVAAVRQHLRQIVMELAHLDTEQAEQEIRRRRK